jgi:hypothetical protein
MKDCESLLGCSSINAIRVLMIRRSLVFHAIRSRRSRSATVKVTNNNFKGLSHLCEKVQNQLFMFAAELKIIAMHSEKWENSQKGRKRLY